MTWLDQLFAWWTNFTNSPTGTALISIATTFIGVIVLFSKTSLGKKIISGMKNELKGFGERVDTTIAKVNEVKELAEKRIQELKDEYEKKLAIITSYVEDVENFLYQLGETIPNAKVKLLVDTFKEQKEARIKEISSVVGTYTDFQELTLKREEIEQEIQNRVLEQVKGFEELYNQKLLEISELIERVKAYGKENTNTEA